MRLLLALILGFWFLSRPPIADVGGTPFARLTFDMIFGNMWTGIIATAGCGALLWSLSKDQVWPWRWRWHGMKDAWQRVLVVWLCAMFNHWFPLNSTDWFSWLIHLSAGGWAIYVLSAEDPLDNKPKPKEVEPEEEQKSPEE